MVREWNDDDVQPYFRDAVRGDLSAIATIVRAADPHDAAVQQRTPAAYRRLLDEVDRHDGCYLLVGEYDSQIGAVLEMVAFPALAACGRTATIVGLWTAEPFRTTGLAGMLLDHAIERAHDLGCSRVEVIAPTARRDERAFWERSGFVQVAATYVHSSEPRLRRIS